MNLPEAEITRLLYSPDALIAYLDDYLNWSEYDKDKFKPIAERISAAAPDILFFSVEKIKFDKVTLLDIRYKKPIGLPKSTYPLMPYRWLISMTTSKPWSKAFYAPYPNFEGNFDYREEF